MSESNTTEPTRSDLSVGGRRLSYVDFGGAGRPVLAVHGHLDQGVMWKDLAAALAPQWRVIAPDQRGHGHSDRAADYSRGGVIGDLAELIERLDLGPMAVLGHSLGGLNAFQLAARRPDLVQAMIIEEIGAVISGPGTLEFLLGAPYHAEAREELIKGLGRPPHVRAPPTAVGRRHLEAAVPPRGHGRIRARQPRRPLGGLAGHRLPRAAPPRPGKPPHRRTGRADGRQRPNTNWSPSPADHFLHVQDPDHFHAAIRDFLAAVYTLNIQSSARAPMGADIEFLDEIAKGSRNSPKAMLTRFESALSRGLRPII